jgi:hypothetical protein
MPATATDTRNTSTATPMSDATKLFAESSRRTVDGSKAVVEAARGLLDDATEVNTRYFQAWVAGAEGALKASFELQNASFTAMSAFVDAAFAGQRSALEQSRGALHSGQQAVLDAFKAQVRAAGPDF